MDEEKAAPKPEPETITSSLTMAQRTLGYLADQVHYGRVASVVLTKNGKPWAKIVRIEEAADA